MKYSCASLMQMVSSCSILRKYELTCLAHLLIIVVISRRYFESGVVDMHEKIVDGWY